MALARSRSRSPPPHGPAAPVAAPLVYLSVAQRQIHEQWRLAVTEYEDAAEAVTCARLLADIAQANVQRLRAMTLRLETRAEELAGSFERETGRQPESFSTIPLARATGRTSQYVAQ